MRNQYSCPHTRFRSEPKTPISPTPLRRDLEACDKLYEQCIEIRNFEISNLVSRNNFFMVFQGVLIAGLIQASGSAPPIVQFLACAVGLALSILQFMTASGAKFWQEAWENQLERTERRLARLVHSAEGGRYFRRLFSEKIDRTEKKVRARLCSKKDRARLSSSIRNMADFVLVRRYSVSKAPIYAGLAFTLFWLLMLLFTLKGSFGSILLSFVIGFPKK